MHNNSRTQVFLPSMVVVIDIRNLLVSHISGVGYYTCELVNELVRDTSIHWILYCNQGTYSTLPESIERLSELSHVEMVRTRYPNKILNLALASGMVSLDRIVARHTSRGPISWVICPNLGFIGVSRGVRTMLVVHDLSFERFPAYYSWRMRIWHHLIHTKRLIARATTIVVPSESTKRDVVSLYEVSQSKIEVIPHGAPEGQGQERVEVPSTVPGQFFLAISTIEPRKNFESIVRAYKESGLHRRGIGLVIGGGYGWNYARTVELFNTTPGVVYLGYISEEMKKELLSRTIALVYPSFYEGFGLPILEAFRAGAPVITSDCSSLPEVSDGAAYLVRPQSIADIAHALRDMASSEELRQWYRGKGYERLKDFSWEKAATRVRACLYKKL